MAGVYDITKGLLAQETLGWASPLAVFKALLVAPTYVFNALHQHVSDVVAHEVSGGTYARVLVTARTASFDIGTGRGVIDADDSVFPDLTVVSAAGIIIYRQVGGNDSYPGASPVILYYDFPLYVSDGSNLKFEYSVQGLTYLTS